jgi:NAD+ kinase
MTESPKPEGEAIVAKVHHPGLGTSECEAKLAALSEAWEGRPDSKGPPVRDGSSKAAPQVDGHHGVGQHHDIPEEKEDENDDEEGIPRGPSCTMICCHDTSGSEDEVKDDDESDDEPVPGGRRVSCVSVGQLDEKHWRRQMMGKRPARTPSQLDKQTSSADAPNSRLLTKKQLSEMAWGVRELSRRLGNMRLRFRVRTIFLLTKIYDQELIIKTRELCRWLLDRQRDVRYVVYVERDLRDSKRFDMAGLLRELRDDYVAAGELSEEGAAETLAKRLRFWDVDMCRARPHTFDFVITLGGDGTVLYASWLFQRIVPPVLSFALGSLGFLTKFDFGDYQKTLTNAFRDGVTVSLRLRFEVTVMRSQATWSRSEQDGDHVVSEDEQRPKRDLVEELIGDEKDDELTHRPEGTYEVLNEVVVDRGPNPSRSFFLLNSHLALLLTSLTTAMSSIEIFGDDEHFTSVSADGICVSTPTGSTAYNLAAGGSLCHPENPVMLVTAICAHTLSFRPVILPDTIVLRIGVPYDARTSSWASFDGRERIELRPGDYVTVSASRYPFACVQQHGRRSEDWINSISAKLNWNSRQRQKSFKAWEK